jgi:hypothetical protein
MPSMGYGYCVHTIFLIRKLIRFLVVYSTAAGPLNPPSLGDFELNFPNLGGFELMRFPRDWRGVQLLARFDRSGV